ncbi:MAG TPA: hypothetical protein VM451_11080 [Candidatus Limnocylindria bacterium]|nr:hypothetical protein [Candidatus Limnocylindria bacterium]
MQPLRALLLTTALAVAACSGGGAATPSPVPSARPTPTPIAAPVSTAAEAAALVIATNPLFAGTTEYSSEMIGASRWWKATPRAGGGYTIELTVGWGDCEAGCINRHVWTFDVTPEGSVAKVSESGDEVPSDLPA